MNEPLKVKDCMISPTIKLSPNMMVIEAATKLIDNKSAGAPVVDSKNNLIGWLSEYDCLNTVMQVAYYDQRVAVVEDVMQSPAKTVNANASALDLAPTMKGTNPKLYPVVNSDNTLIGVISRRLILHKLCEIASHKHDH